MCCDMNPVPRAVTESRCSHTVLDHAGWPRPVLLCYVMSMNHLLTYRSACLCSSQFVRLRRRTVSQFLTFDSHLRPILYNCARSGSLGAARGRSGSLARGVTRGDRGRARGRLLGWAIDRGPDRSLGVRLGVAPVDITM